MVRGRVASPVILIESKERRVVAKRYDETGTYQVFGEDAHKRKLSISKERYLLPPMCRFQSVESRRFLMMPRGTEVT